MSVSRTEHDEIGFRPPGRTEGGLSAYPESLWNKTAAGAGTVWLISAISVLFIATAGAAIIMRLTKNHLRGSFNEWQQGDWLIHNSVVDIRRGHIGSGLLDLADVFAVSPLSVVFVLHAALVAILFYLLIRVFLLVAQPLVLVPFVFSPPFFVIFWLPWDHAILRKETLTFIAIFLVLLACIKSSPARLVAGSVLLAVSVYGHEANILFLPLYLAVLWLCRATAPRGPLLWFSLAVAVGGAGHAFGYALLHSRLDDLALVCQPLLDRGLHPDFCDGAIFWLTQSFADTQVLMREIYDPKHLILLAGVYALTLIPILFGLSCLENPRRTMILALLAGIPFIPLFFIAVDWGRWISMQVFSMMIITMAALVSGQTRVRSEPSGAAVLAIMALSLLWVPNVVLRFVEWAWYRKIFVDIAEILG